MRKAALVLLVLVGVGSFFALSWLDDDSSEPGTSGGTAPALRLAPGTTLHTVTEKYRRLGDAEAQFRQLDTYVPERAVGETWISFDEGGGLASFRGEVRGAADGVVYGTSAIEDGFIVSRNGAGVETGRYPFDPSQRTVDAMQARLDAASEDLQARLDAHPDAPTVTLDSRPVRLIEDTRAFTRDVPPVEDIEAGEVRLQLPYLSDLAPVQHVTRDYVSEEEMAVVAYEIVVVDELGVETIVESLHYRVYEVLSE